MKGDENTSLNSNLINTQNKEKTNEDKKEKKEEDNINIQENINKIKKKSRVDFWYGFSLFGRLLFTIYSLHGVFFIYNFIIQYIIMFPSLLYSNDMSLVGGFFFSVPYALFAINTLIYY